MNIQTARQHILALRQQGKKYAMLDAGWQYLAVVPADAEITGGQHWAYISPARPTPPAVDHIAIVRNAIDAFILAKLEGLEPPLEPSASAEPGKLLRRVYLDLIGLPPSIAELDAFIADPSPSHYEQIVDRLLASPQYGEKWARQWLDLENRKASSHRRVPRRVGRGYRTRPKSQCGHCSPSRTVGRLGPGHPKPLSTGRAHRCP